MPLEPERPLSGLTSERRSGIKHALVIQTAEKREYCANSENKAKVSDAVNQEGFQIGSDRAITLIPESDQQVGDQSHAFPAEEKLEKIVRHHQHQHCERKECDVTEKPGISRIFRHVADGVDMHHQ